MLVLHKYSACNGCVVCEVCVGICVRQTSNNKTNLIDPANIRNSFSDYEPSLPHQRPHRHTAHIRTSSGHTRTRTSTYIIHLVNSRQPVPLLTWTPARRRLIQNQTPPGADHCTFNIYGDTERQPLIRDGCHMAMCSAMSMQWCCICWELLSRCVKCQLQLSNYALLIYDPFSRTCLVCAPVN
jgi:hypothetical protein